METHFNDARRQSRTEVNSVNRTAGAGAGGARRDIVMHNTSDRLAFDDSRHQIHTEVNSTHRAAGAGAGASAAGARCEIFIHNTSDRLAFANENVEIVTLNVNAGKFLVIICHS